MEKNPLDRTESQPALPVVHRRFANPAPLGLFAFATSLMLISLFGVGARGVTAANVCVGPLVFFGGICQYISGIMEYISGNTVSPLPSFSTTPSSALSALANTLLLSSATLSS